MDVRGLIPFSPIFLFVFFYSLRWDTTWNQAYPVQCYSTSSISNAVSISFLVDYIRFTIVIIYYKASFCVHICLSSSTR